MTVSARTGDHRESVAGDELTLHGITGFVFRACEVALSATETALQVDSMSGIKKLVPMTTNTQRVGLVGRVCSLCVDLVTGGASHSGRSVTTGRPLGQSGRVTRPAQLFRCGDYHTLGRVSFSIGTVTCLTGHTGQHESSGGAVVTRRVAVEALPGPPGALQINLEERVKGRIGVGGA